MNCVCPIDIVYDDDYKPETVFCNGAFFICQYCRPIQMGYMAINAGIDCTKSKIIASVKYTRLTRICQLL